MQTHFYNRTLFRSLGIDIPNCYLELDNVYDQRCPEIGFALVYYLEFAENICRSHADVCFYRKIIVDQYEFDGNPFISSYHITSYLVGYLGAIQSLVDGVGITLNEILKLQVLPRFQDLGRKPLIEKLRNYNTEDYASLDTFFKNLKEWRNSAMHRLHPLVVTHGEISLPPDQVRRSDVDIKMINDPIARENNIYAPDQDFDWITPIEFLEKWDPSVTRIAEMICTDIARRIPTIDLSHGELVE